MKTEADEQGEIFLAEFKNMLFAHSFATQNPELYKKLFPEDLEGEEDEFVVPGSPEELQKMIAEFHASFEVFEEGGEPTIRYEFEPLSLL